MKTEMKAVVAAIVVIALALTAVSGITYSWFSDKESADISVTTGVVDMELSNISIKTYSWDSEAKKYALIQETSTAGETIPFVNSGTGQGTSFSKGTDGTLSVTITGIVAGDYVEIYGDILNKSTIKTIYRTGLTTSESGELADALLMGSSAAIPWTNASVADSSDGYNLGNKLLATIGLDDSYSQNGSTGTCTMVLTLEAYQSNADVDRTTIKGNNTLVVNSDDSGSKLKNATIVFYDSEGRKTVKASEIASSTYSNYTIVGTTDTVLGKIIAGIDMTSEGVQELYKNSKATITMVLDGEYDKDQINVYHGQSILPATTGSYNNTVSVETDSVKGITTVTIVTYDGFSPYLISLKSVMATTSESTTYYNTLTQAAKANETEIKILYDYTGFTVTDAERSTADNYEAVLISNGMTITGLNKVTLTNVDFIIDVNDDTATVSISNLNLETNKPHYNLIHMITLNSSNTCTVSLADITFVTGVIFGNWKMAPIYSQALNSTKELNVTRCVFDIDKDSISEDNALIGIELYGLKSVKVEKCKFNNLTRPFNLDNVTNFTSDDNTFNMPATTNTYQKLFNINQDIQQYTIKNTTVNWNPDSKCDMIGVYIYKNSSENTVSQLQINSTFSSDVDLYVPSLKKLVINSDVTVKNVTVGDTGSIVLANENSKLTASNEVSNISSGVNGKKVNSFVSEEMYVYSLINE